MADLLPHQAQVRLSIRPDELTVVGADEIPGLRAQGLLIEQDPAGGSAPPVPDPATGTGPGGPAGRTG